VPCGGSSGLFVVAASSPHFVNCCNPYVLSNEFVLFGKLV
jgi:hypothetical protein